MPPVNTAILKRRRDELDLSNRELATLVRVTPSYLDNIICGADDPSGRLIHRLARALGVPAEEIEAAGDRTPHGDPSEPPVQPKNDPKTPPRRPAKEQKAPRRAQDSAVAS